MRCLSILTILITFFLIISCIDKKKNSVVSNQMNIPTRSCETKKLLPPQEGYEMLRYFKENITVNSLDSIAKSLKKKILNNEILSPEEDIRLIMIMNTNSWRYLDSSNLIIEATESIQELENVFKEKYLQIMPCKYKTYISPGMGTYFKDIQICYTGNPTQNSRYTIISEMEGSIIKCDIILSKL